MSHDPTKTISSIIIFGTKNKEELESLFNQYKNQLNCYPFFEPYKDIGLTAFATEPIGEEVRHMFRQFKLWKPIEESYQKSCQIMTRKHDNSIKSIL